MAASDAQQEGQGRLSTEMIQKITELANTLAWKKPNLDVLHSERAGQYPPIAEALQRHIKLSDWRKKLVLPNLRAFGNETVAVFTDWRRKRSPVFNIFDPRLWLDLPTLLWK